MSYYEYNNMIHPAELVKDITGAPETFAAARELVAGRRYGIFSVAAAGAGAPCLYKGTFLEYYYRAEDGAVLAKFLTTIECQNIEITLNVGGARAGQIDDFPNEWPRRGRERTDTQTSKS